MASPEDLTKDQLKEELLANGIEIPSGNHRKSVYIDLYKTHIKQRVQEFSSDDNVEVKSSSSKRSVRHQKKKVLKNSSNMNTLEDLTNAEIAARLKSYGQVVGPIVPTTRRVYLKKLNKIMQEEEVKEYSDTEEEIEVEVEVVPAVPVARRSSRRKTMQFPDNPPVVTSKKSSSSTHKRRSLVERTVADTSLSQPAIASATSRRPLRSSMKIEPMIEVVESTTVQEEKISTETREVEEEEDEEKSSKNNVIKSERTWVPIWFQISLTLLVVFFAYLVLQTMEKGSSRLTLPDDKN